jgi:IclR family KDG regulon transcriptional repressor
MPLPATAKSRIEPAKQPGRSRAGTKRAAQVQALDPSSGTQRGGVQSIGRAFAILQEVARHRDGIALAELSKRVGLHNSTTFHLVRTMVSLGYVRQSPDTKRYRIGPPLFMLAAACLDEIEMVSLATPVLENLSVATGESGHFAIRKGDSVVVVARTSGSGAFQLTDRVGVVRPAHCTALGKVLLAALRPQQFERHLACSELKAFTEKSTVDPVHLRREIEEIRRAGVAFDDGEFDAEVRCVAVPVRDFTGQVAGAIGISGPVWRLSLQALQSRARLVQEAAARLSADFGYQPGAPGARSLARDKTEV